MAVVKINHKKRIRKKTPSKISEIGFSAIIEFKYTAKNIKDALPLVFVLVKKGKYDCVSNSFIRSFPDGMDVNVLKANALYKKLIDQTTELTKDLRDLMNDQNLNNYIKSVINISFLTNKYINDEEPWKLKNNVDKMYNILHLALEQIAKISVLDLNKPDNFISFINLMK